MQNKQDIDILIERSIKRGIKRDLLKEQLEDIHSQLEVSRAIPVLDIQMNKNSKLLFLAAALLPLAIGLCLWLMPDNKTYVYERHWAPLSSIYVKDAKSNSISWIEAYDNEDYQQVIRHLEPCLVETVCDPFYKVYLGLAYLRENQIDLAEQTLNEAVREKNMHQRRSRVAQYYYACVLLEKGEIEKSKGILMSIVNHHDQFYYSSASASLLNIIKE